MKSNKRRSIFDSTERFTSNVDKTVNGKEQGDRIFAKNDNPEDFDGTFSTAYMQTTELERKINSVMSTLFEDYHGCIISVVSQNAYVNKSLKVDLFFRPRRATAEDEDTRAFISVEDKITNPNDGDILNAVRRNTAMAKNAASFELTEYAANILWDFMPDALTKGGGYLTSKRIDWRDPSSYARADLISEVVDGGSMGSQLIYSCITGIDIIKILGFIYGVKDPSSKSGILYNVTVDRPATNLPTALGASWIITVTKMTWDAYNKIMPKLGINPTRGTLPINTMREDSNN